MAGSRHMYSTGVVELELISVQFTCCEQQTWKLELGYWVTGLVGHLGHLSRPGHRVIILTRCETRVFPVFEKVPKMQNVHLKC